MACNIPACPQDAGANGFFCDIHYGLCPGAYKGKIENGAPAVRDAFVARAITAITAKL